MCIDKVVKRLEDPFPPVLESVNYGESQNVVNDTEMNLDHEYSTITS